MNNKVEILKTQIEKLQQILKEELAKNLNRRWHAQKVGDLYYTFCDGSAVTLANRNDVESGYEIGNYFHPCVDIDLITEYLKIRMKIIEVIHELNDGEEVDWNNPNQDKYELSYNYEKGEFMTVNVTVLRSLGFVCLKEDWEKDLVERVGLEHLKFFFDFNWEKVYFPKEGGQVWILE